MSRKYQHKRMLGYLKTPQPANDRELIYKIVVDEIRNQGTFVYLYLSPDAVRGSYDDYYHDAEDAVQDSFEIIAQDPSKYRAELKN